MIYEIKIKDLKPKYLIKLIDDGWLKAKEAADPEKIIATFVLNNYDTDRQKKDLIY